MNFFHRHHLTKYTIIIFAYAAVLYPLWVRFQTITWESGQLLQDIFPFLGLAAFSILWLHVISGVFEPWLKRRFDFDFFVHWTSLVVLVLIILHPVLAFINAGSSIRNLFLYGPALYVWLGIIGWLLLLTYDIGKLLQRHEFFVRHWRKILFMSTIGIISIFFHSLSLGSDLQSGPLRVVWLFYGITAILATIYTYSVKPFLK